MFVNFLIFPFFVKIINSGFSGFSGFSGVVDFAHLQNFQYLTKSLVPLAAAYSSV